MNEVILPFGYYLAFAITGGAAFFGLANLGKAWAAPFLAVLGTFFMWYLIEPIYAPETWYYFDQRHIETAYWSASLFIVSFVGLFFWLRPKFRPAVTHRSSALREVFFSPGAIPPERLAVWAISLWLVLLIIGTMRLNGDLMQALFPLDMRNGVKMWQRYAGARAGPTGFLVSMANYLYILVLSSFGLLLTLVRKPQMRLVLFLVILVAWPYAFLIGGRNVAVAVVTPLFAGFFLFTRSPVIIKLASLAVGFFAMEFAMRAIIAMRNTGFDMSRLDNLDQQRHLGLNMGSELIRIAGFIDSGVYSPNWGARYFAEVVNFIPRSLWPGKPLIGVDYAIMRGFGGASNDIGLFATISTGMVGQGAVNFGMWLGPLSAALLMALWANLLTRLRLQATAPRIALFLVGLGLTFNLGRDISLLVLFPFVFGFFAVRGFEYLRGSAAPNTRGMHISRAPDSRRWPIGEPRTPPGRQRL